MTSYHINHINHQTSSTQSNSLQLSITIIVQWHVRIPDRQIPWWRTVQMSHLIISTLRIPGKKEYLTGLRLNLINLSVKVRVIWLSLIYYFNFLLLLLLLLLLQHLLHYTTHFSSLFRIFASMLTCFYLVFLFSTWEIERDSNSCPHTFYPILILSLISFLFLNHL